MSFRYSRFSHVSSLERTSSTVCAEHLSPATYARQSLLTFVELPLPISSSSSIAILPYLGTSPDGSCRVGSSRPIQYVSRQEPALLGSGLKRMALDHDQIFKQLIEAFFREFMELFCEGEAAQIDFRH